VEELLDGLGRWLSGNGLWLAAAVVAAFVGVTALRLYLGRRAARGERSDEERLVETALLRGMSEYELFSEAARTWGIAEHRVEEDFKRYLHRAEIPFYVRDHLKRVGTEGDCPAVSRRKETGWS
jgi:hypothetical protein